MARTVEHDRRHVVDHTPERLGDRPHVVADRPRELDRAACARADGHLAHVHVRERRHRPTRRRGDHRDRVRPAARDDRAPLERIECEVVGLAAGTDRRARGKLLAFLRRADHDTPVDRHLLEREPRARERRLFGGLLVRTAEPARTGQRRPLGHPRERLTDALAPFDLGRGGLPHAHAVCRARSAARITSSITWSIVRSTLAFSTTGTSSRRARATTYVWIRRMSSSFPRYLSIARIPPVLASRT